jgi:hypothetical protein
MCALGITLSYSLNSAGLWCRTCPRCAINEGKSYSTVSSFPSCCGPCSTDNLPMNCFNYDTGDCKAQPVGDARTGAQAVQRFAECGYSDQVWVSIPFLGAVSYSGRTPIHGTDPRVCSKFLHERRDVSSAFSLPLGA